MPQSKTIALIGLRGTGKSTVGRTLAQVLAWTYCDSDALIEFKAGKTIRQIFEDEGEARFRALEAEIVQTYATQPKTVLATGGGAVLNEQSRMILKTNCHVVWLMASIDLIMQRISQDITSTEQRPALTDLPARQEIEKLWTIREPIYRELAHHSIIVDAKTPESIVGEIISSFQ